MSNVVKIAVKKKKSDDDAEAWKDQIETLGDRLMGRLSDAIRLADEEANDEGMPEEIADCTILGVIVGMLVDHAYARNVIGPEALMKLVEYQIHGYPGDDA